MLDQATKNIIKATAPILADKGLDVMVCMYDIMFTRYPAIKSLFNMANQRQDGQPLALARAVHAYAANIDQLDQLTDAVDLMAHKHASLGVRPEHYPIVGECLLEAIDNVLQPGATVLAAWEKGYNFLAEILINAEKDLYHAMATVAGGWDGYRVFTIARKEKESDVITSFYLEPKDGKPLCDYKPGQYITVKLDFPGRKSVTRNYSLSDKPNQAYYRISVKRERRPLASEHADGLISCYLHDFMEEGTELEVRAPIGNFFLEPNTARPVVLLSGGVGLTPMISMLSTIAAQHPTLETYFIHGAINRKTHAMREYVNKLANTHPNIHQYTCYSAPDEQDLAHRYCHHTGFITAEWLSNILPHTNCDYYFCGPKPFMQLTYGILKQWNIPAAQIRYEFFGPTSELEKAVA